MLIRLPEHSHINIEIIDEYTTVSISLRNWMAVAALVLVLAFIMVLLRLAL